MMKRKLNSGIPFIFLAGISILLIPFNLFIHSFPTWIVWADIALLLLCAVCVICQTKTTAPKVIAIVVCIIVSTLLLFASNCCPYWNSVSFTGGYKTIVHNQLKISPNYDTEISFSDAKSDVDQVMKTLTRIHPAFLNGIPEEISEAYEESIQRLEQKENITVSDVRREISLIMALLGDGHTSVYYLGNALYLNDAIARAEEGWQLIEINDIPMDTVVSQSLSLYSYEAESDAINSIYPMTRSSSGLTFLGFDPFDLKMTWQKDDIVETVSYGKEDYAPDIVYTASQTQETTPSSDSFVSYAIDKENDLAVLTLKECTYNEEYISCVRDFFTEVKEYKIGNVAVDLRSNGGGNSLVATEFIKYLPIDSYNVSTYQWRWGPFCFDSDNGVRQNKSYETLTFDGNVFVLTDTATFSSATNFASFISDNNLGTVIGEMSSNSLNSFGDITIFQLKNTGLLLSVSTKSFLRADQSKGDFVTPDIECPAEDALEVLKEYIRK